MIMIHIDVGRYAKGITGICVKSREGLIDPLACVLRVRNLVG